MSPQLAIRGVFVGSLPSSSTVSEGATVLQPAIATNSPVLIIAIKVMKPTTIDATGNRTDNTTGDHKRLLDDGTYTYEYDNLEQKAGCRIL
ncbi:MAG: hypothetical protein AAF773_09380 [Cyanobacteria bacterium P01_D01_bin.115]